MSKEFFEGFFYGCLTSSALLILFIYIHKYYMENCTTPVENQGAHTNTFKIVTNYNIHTDEKRILDDENKFHCLVCLETITDPNMPVIECLSCQRYLSHVRCFEQWNQIHSTCMYCRK
jgi:hypothetical protein